jgi:hypothetical protein
MFVIAEWKVAASEFTLDRLGFGQWVLREEGIFALLEGILWRDRCYGLL